MTSVPASSLQAHLEPPIELEVARLISAVVNLDCAPEDIEPTEPLFGDGLGLDSIDLLEIALAISQNYGISLRSDDPENLKTFSSLRALSTHIAQHRTK